MLACATAFRRGAAAPAMTLFVAAARPMARQGRAHSYANRRRRQNARERNARRDEDPRGGGGAGGGGDASDAYRGPTSDKRERGLSAARIAPAER